MSTTVTTQIPTGTWSLDPIHSSIGFGVRHLGVSTFRGSFKAAAGSLVTEDDRIASIEGTVRVENLSTEEPSLTGHLFSPDFFDAANHPEITFASTAIEPAGDGNLKVTGDLTIRGVTRPVELDAEVEGVGDGPDGTTRIGIAAQRRHRPHRVGHHLEQPASQRRAHARRARHADAPRRSRQAGLIAMNQVEILAIPGSLRAGSWNAALLRLAQERAPEGVRVEIWDGLRDIPPFSEDHEILAPLPVEGLRAAIAGADALLVATPEYNGGAPGQLKNALDWASRPYGLSAVVGKPAGVISASTGSFGGRWAQEEIRKALRLSGAAVIGEGLAVGKAAERLAELGDADPEITSGIDDVLERLVTAIAEQQMLVEEDVRLSA